jgi:competence transcription factor ComK
MKRAFSVLFFLLPLICLSQTDVLILQKNGQNIKTYAPGLPIMIHTVYDQWLGGTITDLKNDSVFVNNNPFHVNEIDAIRTDFSKLHLQNAGTIMIIAGVGVLALNVINGLYTNEPIGSWIKVSGYITAGVFIIAGILMRSAKFKNYPIGKKYTLHYLNLRPHNSPGTNSSNTKEPAK